MRIFFYSLIAFLIATDIGIAIAQTSSPSKKKDSRTTGSAAAVKHAHDVCVEHNKLRAQLKRKIVECP